MAESGRAYTATSNTRECFSICVGRKVIGVLFDALPLHGHHRHLDVGTTTLVFEDGYGLTISSRGTFWTETKDDIARAVAVKRKELSHTEAEIRSLLALAGELE